MPNIMLAHLTRKVNRRLFANYRITYYVALSERSCEALMLSCMRWISHVAMPKTIVGNIRPSRRKATADAGRCDAPSACDPRADWATQ